MIVLGVDGGNTKTVCLAALPDGTIVGSGRSGCSDIYGAASPRAAVDAIEGAVRSALQDCVGASVEAAAFSLAGADWPEDFEYLRSRLRRRLGFRSPVVVHDAIGALRSGSPEGTGVSVVCGTGAAIGSRSPNGCVWHAGFWLGPGGAEELGREALRAVYRAELEVGGPTSLSERLLDLFNEADVEALLHRFTRRQQPAPGSEIPRAARTVLDEAERGDRAARQIVTRHALMLGEYALVAARKVGIDVHAFNLVLAGGLFRHPSTLLADTIAGRVRETAPRVQVLHARLPPAAGAVLLALESIGALIDEALLARAQATLPPPTLFET